MSLFSALNTDKTQFFAFDNLAAWENAVAEFLSTQIQQQVETSGHSRVLLSGGTTPTEIYRKLAESSLEWSKVEFALVDERYLASDDPNTNQVSIHNSLLEKRSAEIQFVPLIQDGKTVEQAVEIANLHAKQSIVPFLAVLGMGNDGHTASLFPNSVSLPAAVNSPETYAAMNATGCPGSGKWPHRITLTPKGLAQIDQLVLLMRGEEKRALFEQALQAGDAFELPIRFALQAAKKPLVIYWCA